MKRNVAGLVIVFVGAAVLQLAISGTYLRYVKPGMRWMLLAAGLILIILAITDVLMDMRKNPAEDEPPPARPEDAWRDAPWRTGRRDDEVDQHTHSDDDGHGHHGLPRAAWLLLIPIFALLVVDPPALGADAAQRQSPVAAKPVQAQGNAYWQGNHSFGAATIAVRDYAVWAVWNTDSMKGRTFQLTGFVTPDQNGVWYITRIGITCCVADASAFMIEARGHAAPPKNRWVTVTGTWAEPTKRADGDVAALTVQSIKQVPAPANPYE
ncbi:TIGR03943 family putative permease subunit [Kribbella sp.]|uniref:TIGR03943 family putative permease subunit n=1 Tax=Kribbella sp. TaxID=1871183 RepID=UPI002D50BD7E|nr:TIGR03943 family protein [Kribbella sp.]HZX02136.1 TIGR03943 family protein [Kribbella sp.]